MSAGERPAATGVPAETGHWAVDLLLWLLVGGALAVLGWAVAITVSRLRRLDRLHARVDAARAGLLAALDRRASLALVAAAVPGVGSGSGPGSGPGGGPGGGPEGAAGSPARAVAAARAAGNRWPEREAAENRLGRALVRLDRSRLPTGLAGRLLEAEQLLVLARRVHNDAVRDTLGLRSRRLVRWLHLAGTAPLPRYFEIADPADGPVAVPAVEWPRAIASDPPLAVTTTAPIGPHERPATGPG